MFTNNFNQKSQQPEKKSFGNLTNNARTFKEERDLINLFSDIEISPQAGKKLETKIDDLQMKELEKFLSSTGTSCLQKSSFTTEHEKEFQKFFDKYEHKAKEDIPANKIEMRNKEVGSSASFINSNFKPSKVLTIKKNEEQIQEPIEDLIDEVLLEKHLMKHHLNSTKILSCNDEIINFDKCKSSSPLYNRKNGRNNKSDIMEQIVLNNNITFSTSKVNDDVYLTNNVLLTKKEIPKYSNAEIKELVSKYNLTYLEAIKIDEKSFKRSVLKSEAEKKLLTPGPTLHNKSVVLPQIMKRLADKKKTLDEQTNIKRKLVLDTSSSHCKPVEDSAFLDVNPSGKTFNLTTKQNLTENPNFQSRKTQLAQVSVSNSDKIFTSFNQPKNNKSPETFGLKNNQYITAKNDGIHKDSRFIHIDKLKALRKEKILSDEIEDPLMIGGKILRPPQPLMTDCNKTRFVANATSQLINDFVNGKR